MKNISFHSILSSTSELQSCSSLSSIYTEQHKQFSYPLLSNALREWISMQYKNIFPPSIKNLNSKNESLSLKQQKLNNSLVEQITNNLFTGNFLGKLLLKINYQYFSKTQLQQLFDYNLHNISLLNSFSGNSISMQNSMKHQLFDQRRIKYIKLIQKYLQYYENKKFTQKYRHFMYHHNHHIDYQSNRSHSGQGEYKQNIIQQTIRLLLFLSIRSQNKDYFIESIFTLCVSFQQQLMSQILLVESNLQSITQIKQILQQTKKSKHKNYKLKQKYNKLVQKQNTLLDQGQKNQYQIDQLLKQTQQINKQKQFIYTHLDIYDVNHSYKPYLTVYKKILQKNTILNRILNQKQYKQNQLYDQYLNKYKLVLNERKNQSFNLQMRASLRMSADKQNYKKSQAFKRKSLCHMNKIRINLSNSYEFMTPNTLKLINNSNINHQHIHESMNILSKLQQLKSQHQSLSKQLQDLKQNNILLKRKNGINQKSFDQLSQIYKNIMRLLHEYFNVNIDDYNLMNTNETNQINSHTHNCINKLSQVLLESPNKIQIKSQKALIVHMISLIININIKEISIQNKLLHELNQLIIK